MRDSCKIEGCGDRATTHGHCLPHWLRIQRNGDPGSPRIQRRSVIRRGAFPERFRVKLGEHADPDACWEWPHRLDPDGYGFMQRDGEKLRTHRIAWELEHGRPVPDGLLVCHSCDNRRCCNPAHLFLGTVRDNARDAAIKGRLRKGANNPAVKVPDCIVRDVVARLRSGETGPAILADIRASGYACSLSSVYNWRCGLTRAPALAAGAI